MNIVAVYDAREYFMYSKLNHFAEFNLGTVDNTCPRVYDEPPPDSVVAVIYAASYFGSTVSTTSFNICAVVVLATPEHVKWPKNAEEIRNSFFRPRGNGGSADGGGSLLSGGATSGSSGAGASCPPFPTAPASSSEASSSGASASGASSLGASTGNQPPSLAAMESYLREQLADTPCPPFPGLASTSAAPANL